MKKRFLTQKFLLVGSILLFVVIFGVGFYMSKRSSVDDISKEERAKITQLAIRAKVFDIAFVFEQWLEKNNRSYAGFTDNKENMDQIGKLIGTLEEENRVKVTHFVASTQNHYVVRIQSAEHKKSYCIDSTTLMENETPLLNDSQFKANTDCDGNPL